MQISRRKFFINLGLTGLTTTTTHSNLSANSGIRTSKNDNKNDLTILFQGDSITDGKRSRNNDWNHVMGHGYIYIVASRLWMNGVSE